MHPLDGANERINGARERLEELKPEVHAFRNHVRSRVTYQRRTEIITLNGRQRRVMMGAVIREVMPAPQRLSRLVGNVIQELRIALNYLTYELTCFDAKAIIDRTQFPIGDTEKVFKDLLGRYNLRGNLTPEHIAALERLQPYKGCNWTKWLATFSNPDKHETLTAIASPVGVTPSPVSADAFLAGQEVDMQGDISISITFSEGTPVIEGLEQLVSEVTKTLTYFYSEFQRG